MLALNKPKSQPFLRNRLLRDASWVAVYDAMKADSSVHVFGEGAAVKAHYDAPAIERDFSDRVHTMPICEDGSTNFCVGAALLGVKPIMDVISADFLFRAMDSICNTAAKLDYVTGKPHTIVIRAETMIGGPTTGQRPEAMFAHVPGLNVVLPSTPRDAYGLMATALKTPGVTLFIEDRMIADAAPWLDGDLDMGKPVPFGSLGLRWLPMKSQARKVPLVTVLTYGVMRQRVEDILAPWLEAWDGDPYVEPNLSVDLLDLRSIYPINWDELTQGRSSLSRTGKLLIIEPDIQYGGVGAEIAAHIAEVMPSVKVKRLGARRATIPARADRHHLHLPSDQEVIDAILSF